MHICGRVPQRERGTKGLCVCGRECLDGCVCGYHQAEVPMIPPILLLLSACAATDALQLQLHPRRVQIRRVHPVSLSAASNNELASSQATGSGADIVAATPNAATPAWVERLNKVSNFASSVCAIDCTVFPILLAVLPLINVAGGGMHAWLHKAAHAVALYFVAPVGGAAVASNALQHRKAHIFGWGFSGIALVLLANIHLPHVLLGWHVPHSLEHWLHAKHSIINVTGCVLLLSSQWYAHRVLERMGKCCGHSHGGHGHHHPH